VGEAIRNHQLPPDVRVLAIGRHPCARALSLFRFLKKYSKFKLPECPSKAVMNASLFKAAESYTHGMGRAAAHIVSGHHGVIFPLTQLFRIEDQFNDWLDAVEEILGFRPEVPRINVSPDRWREATLTAEAEAQLRCVWGSKDWNLFGYD
jgi:hypothetical protein